MPYRRTLFLAGHHYHLYNRGVDRGEVFIAPENYSYLLRLLKKNRDRYAVGMVAYCLLPNHYHLLVSPSQDDNLHLFIKSVFGSYVQGFNKQQSRVGPLFQSRYRSILVEGEDYLAHLARYIHLNPVAAGMSSSPSGWPFSNYLDVIGQRRGSLRDGTLVPQLFPTCDAYQRFVEDRDCWQPPPRLGRFFLE
jgi:REP element-mobilizing transposase RayT